MSYVDIDQHALLIHRNDICLHIEKIFIIQQITNAICPNRIARHVATSNFRSLNTVNQLPELIASGAEHYLDMICILDHRYYHSEQEIKYHDTDNGWTIGSLPAWKNTINAIIEGVGMVLCPCDLKSKNNMEKIKPRMMLIHLIATPENYHLLLQSHLY